MTPVDAHGGTGAIALEDLEARWREWGAFHVLHPPLHPRPPDPAICRWCGRERRLLATTRPYWYCPSGCYEAPTFRSLCGVCGKAYLTGTPELQDPHLCALHVGAGP